MTAAVPPDGDGVPPPPLTAEEIAAIVEGELHGRGDAEVDGVAALDRAGPRDLSFLAARQYLPLFSATRAGVVLVAPSLLDSPASGDGGEGEGEGPSARIVVKDPHAALLRLLPRFFREAPRPVGIHPTALVGSNVRLGADVAIGAYAVVGDGASIGDRAWIGEHAVVGADVVLGDDVRLHPAATVYPRAVIGNRVILHSGTRIGCDGFGYAFEQGQHQKVPHVGRCILHDDVEVGANSTIDRGSVDDTVIGAGTKIDNLVHVGHNVRIGRLCMLVAQVGVAGSVRVGDGVLLGGQAGIAGHLTIGDRARVAAQAGVVGDVPAGETWSGYPARPHREALRASAAMFKLPDIIRKLEKLVAGRE